MCTGLRAHREQARIRGLHESRRAGENGSPGLAVSIDAADQHEGKQREEVAMLLGHEVADEGAVAQALAHARADLQLQLAFVERGACGWVHRPILLALERPRASA